MRYTIENIAKKLKMYTMKKKLLIAASAALALFIVGCEHSTSTLEDITGGETIAEAEIAYLKSTESTDSDISSARFGAHLFKGGMRVGGSHLFFGKGFPACATVTVEDSGDEDGFPKTVTIDYGEGCSGRMGMGRTGTITIVMSDTITNAGAVYTITYNDVTIGNRQIEKSATITNQGMVDENWIITRESLTTTTFERDGETLTIVREFSGQKEWLAGFDTPQMSDDQFLKSGNGTITVNDELKFEKRILDEAPLFIDRACRFPLSGIVEITKDGETMTIDYGAGECDNLALVTKGDESEEIELNKGKFRDGFQRHKRHMKQKKGWW